MDAVGEKVICADHVGRCGVLPCTDGPPSHLSAHPTHKIQMTSSARFIMRFVTAALVAVMVSLVPKAGAQDMGLEVGSQAPNVAAQTLDGKQVYLSQYIGKTPMLIEFWAT